MLLMFLAIIGGSGIWGVNSVLESLDDTENMSREVIGGARLRATASDLEVDALRFANGVNRLLTAPAVSGLAQTGNEETHADIARRRIDTAVKVGAGTFLLCECGHTYTALRWAEFLQDEPLPFKVMYISEFLGRDEVREPSTRYQANYGVGTEKLRLRPPLPFPASCAAGCRRRTPAGRRRRR